ncbi:MAG: hypothetical protein MR332_03720 [Fusicatenibacter sp.]|nr:hypothetical protein [Fusicatenibacter sp.]
MKRNWERPSVMVQEFEANEYVAACWTIACDYGELGGDGDYPDPVQPNNTDITHAKKNAGTGCGWAVNQYIYEDSDGNFRITETHTDGLGDLTCRLSLTGYDNLSSSISLTETQINNGVEIFWTTTSEIRTWSHYGTIEAKFPGHPNRS